MFSTIVDVVVVVVVAARMNKVFQTSGKFDTAFQCQFTPARRESGFGERNEMISLMTEIGRRLSGADG